MQLLNEFKATDLCAFRSAAAVATLMQAFVSVVAGTLQAPAWTGDRRQLQLRTKALHMVATEPHVSLSCIHHNNLSLDVSTPPRPRPPCGRRGARRCATLAAL